MRRKQQSEKERNAGTTHKKVYLGYRINPKLLCVSPFFFSVSPSVPHYENEKRRRTMRNTLGGGTGGGREQQQTRNQAVGSGDNGGVVPAKFSSKQSKTSTVTITGALIVSSVRFLIRSLSRVISVIVRMRMSALTSFLFVFFIEQ